MTPPGGDEGGITARRPLLDWRAIGIGAAVALAVSLPVIAAVEVVDATVGIGCDSNVVFLPYLVILAALVAGARRAGRRAPETPLTHGALAALAAYVGIVAVGAVLRLVSSGASHCPRSPVALVSNGLMSASAGILGGLLATRSPRSRRRPAEEPDPEAPPVA